MGKITVAGVGLTEDQLTLGTARLLKSCEKVILHTSRAAVANWLRQSGVPFEALDFLYETIDDFDAHARAAADFVVGAAKETDVVYCVFDVRDESAVLLANTGARVIPGPPLEGALLGRVSGETLSAPASGWADFAPDASRPMLVRELDSRTLAGEVKLRLMEAYPDDARVDVLTSGGIAPIPLYDLDRLAHYDHATAALIYPERDLARRQCLTARDVQVLIRKDPIAYAPVEYDALCAAAVRLVGGAAYAEDRGEFDLDDIFCEACRKLLSQSQ